MNITDEFYRISGVDKIKYIREDTFYDTIIKDIENINRNINVMCYNKLISIEDELEKMTKEINDLFSSIGVENELKDHFNGIKFIIFKRLGNVTKRLEDRKLEFINKNVELEPEYSKDNFLDFDDAKNVVEDQYDQEMKVYEQEIKMRDEYEQARKSISEIKNIQKIITVNLMEQGEQIENIIKKNKNIKKNVDGTVDELKKIKDKRRRSRRMLFILQLCVIFILLFLHFFYCK
ncbi:hypothetical protein SLOPH_1829 [Spraguea lophii 42_110]|uniref:t-SNARE coiled-coil homology domain-containing protein n=1 Tax=Spraguea lophii (strain 42_110) TaxID=1358809 RepID=S7WA68_SPRLO|nr:hypothetical protein SLOPH_1829 [Spraguea lophii 42_110]